MERAVNLIVWIQHPIVYNKGLYIHEFGGEDDFMKYIGLGDIDLRIAVMSVNLIGFKKKYTKTDQLIFKLNKENS